MNSNFHLTKLICFIAAFCWLSAGYGQHASDKLRPRWMSNLPKASNGSFDFKIAMGEAVELNEARHQCVADLLAFVAQSHKVQNEEISTTNVQQQHQNGQLDEGIKTSYVFKFTVQGEVKTLLYQREDEYWEQLDKPDGKTVYRCYTLYSLARQASGAQFDKLTFSKQYGMRGFARSMIVPGWGQLHKGNTTKGIAIMLGEVALGAGIIASENLRLDYKKKIKETENVDQILTYADKASNAKNVRNLCIGFAGALYVYNLVDAIVANGSKRTITKPAKFAFIPVMDLNYTGVGLCYHF